MGDLFVQANNSILSGNVSDQYLRNYVKNAMKNRNKKEKLDFDIDSFFLELDSGRFSEEEKRKKLETLYIKLKKREDLADIFQEDKKTISSEVPIVEELNLEQEKIDCEKVMLDDFANMQKKFGKTEYTKWVSSNSELLKRGENPTKISRWAIELNENPQVIIN